LIVGGLHNADDLQEILPAGQLQPFAKLVVFGQYLAAIVSLMMAMESKSRDRLE